MSYYRTSIRSISPRCAAQSQAAISDVVCFAEFEFLVSVTQGGNAFLPCDGLASRERARQCRRRA